MEDISLYEAGDLLQGTEGTEVLATCSTWRLQDTSQICYPLFALCCLGLIFLGRIGNPYVALCSRLHPGGSENLQMPTGGAKAEAA